MTSDINARFEKIRNLIGNTPLLQINFRYKGEERKIFAKAEYFNLTGSIKDRVAWYIMKKAYEQGKVKPGDTSKLQAAIPVLHSQLSEGISATG